MFSLEWQVSDGNRHTPGRIAGLDLSSGHTRSSYADTKAFGRQGQDIPPQDTGSVYGFTGRERFSISLLFFPFLISFLFLALAIFLPISSGFLFSVKKRIAAMQHFSQPRPGQTAGTASAFFFFCSAFCFYFSASFVLSYFLVFFSLLSLFLSTELWVHGIFWGSHGIKRGLLRA